MSIDCLNEEYLKLQKQLKTKEKLYDIFRKGAFSHHVVLDVAVVIA